MRSIVKFSSFVLVTLLLLVGVTPAFAGSSTVEKTECVQRITEVLDPGETIRYGDLLYIKGLKYLFKLECDQEWFSGEMVATLVEVIYPDGSGTFHAHLRFMTDEGGSWKGRSSGGFDAEGNWFQGRGVGFGIYEGYRFDATGLNDVVTITRYMP